MANPYRDKIGRFSTKSGAGSSLGGSSRRPGQGSGATDKYVAKSDDLSSLRGRIGSDGEAAKVESMAQYKARLANERMESTKAFNRATGKKPLPKGYNADSAPFKVVNAEDLPSTGTPRPRANMAKYVEMRKEQRGSKGAAAAKRAADSAGAEQVARLNRQDLPGRGMTHTQAIQQKMNRQSAENAKLPKPSPDAPWMRKARAQAEEAMKPVSASSSNSAKLANVAKIYGKNSSEYKSARKTLFRNR
jgi:hypothetical protein